MPGKGSRENIRSERAQATVEMALVMSVLLLVLTGTIEFGRILNAHISVTHAAREGVRLAALGKTDSEVVAAVKNAAASLDPNRLTVNITPDSPARETGVPVTVDVQYSVDIIVPIISSLIANPFPIHARISMRME